VITLTNTCTKTVYQINTFVRGIAVAMIYHGRLTNDNAREVRFLEAIDPRGNLRLTDGAITQLRHELQLRGLSTDWPKITPENN